MFFSCTWPKEKMGKISKTGKQIKQLSKCQVLCL